MKVMTPFRSEKKMAATLMVASLAALAFALAAQYVFNLQPCILCLYQRAPYAVAVILGSVALLKPTHARGLLVFMGTCFVVGIAIAGFHTGVEHGWWEGTKACGGNGLPQNASLDDMKKYLSAQPIVRCDVAGWKLFGLSMTEYNFGYSALLAAMTFEFLRRPKDQ